MAQNRTYDTYNPELPYNQEIPPVEEKFDQGSAIPGSPSSHSSGKKKTTVKKAVKKPKTSSAPVMDFGKLASGIRKLANAQNVRVILGCLCGCAGLYMLVCFLSYFSSCITDQSLILNSENGTLPKVENAGGEGGARMADFLINDGFGLGSFVIVLWLIGMSLKHLIGWPRFKSVNFTIKCIVALITVSLIVGLLTIGMDTSVNWGGNHGRYVNEFIIGYFGWSGAGILCLFMVIMFVVICLRDFINWILRIKHARDERKRLEAEARELAEARERELAEMKAREDEDAAKAGDNISVEDSDPSDDTHVTFGTNDSNFYTSLPDFEDYDISDTESSDTEAGGESPLSDSTNVKSEITNDLASENVVGESSSAIVEDSDDATKEKMVVNVNQIDIVKDGEKSSISNTPGILNYKFPPFDLLRAGAERINVDTEEQLENKEKIRKTLLDFGIPIVSIEATVGPTVTLYEIKPDNGVRIAKIRSLVDDIALSLSAIGVRIIAPIPGRGTVGIEVANKDPQTVSMRTVIQSRTFQDKRCPLPIAMGSTIDNNVCTLDLAKMPHLLVAGATGQGKSVGLNAIIASLLYKLRPDQLKFVMIDPKMVEFSLYAKLENHYLAKLPDEEDPIITDMSKAVATLNSLCVEMDDRYMLLKMARARNIEEYNPKVTSHSLNPAEGHRFMPYIVVIVDEFSDLIMTAGKEVEIPIARLAQKARAVGMHVILATQRPSTNVITGIIKANFPARIAFKVSSGVDSKTILDTTGAQQLIGRGDMLISNNSELVRVQCAFIDTPEVEAICDYIERQPYPQGPYILPEPKMASADEETESATSMTERDPLFDEIARLIVNSNTASTSSLQRRYSIGYNRAGKIMDQMEAAGIVGPSHGGKPRSVLVDAVGLEALLASV